MRAHKLHSYLNIHVRRLFFVINVPVASRWEHEWIYRFQRRAAAQLSLPSAFLRCEFAEILCGNIVVRICRNPTHALEFY